MAQKDGVEFRFHTREVRDMLRTLARQGEKNIRHGVEQSGRELNNLIKNEILNQSGSGRTYLSRRGTETSGTHQASAPGEPPAPDTNTYRNSWRTKELGGGFTIAVFTPDDRGPMLEDGTKHIEPRPHVFPAVKRHDVIHKQILFKALRQAARAASR